MDTVPEQHSPPFSETISRSSAKPYEKPQLRVLGDLRGMTFGPSPGIGDSVLPATRKVAGT